MEKKVLVVDNHPLHLKLLANLLKEKGYKVLVAKDGLQALEILETFVPSIIFTDLIMPNIGGDKLCRLIRSTPRFDNTYLVIISGIAAEEKLDFCSWGANACIAKGPFKAMATHVLAVLERAEQLGVHDSLPEILGLDGVFQREVTKELLFSNKHLQVTLDNMSEGLMEIVHDTKIVYANPAVSAVLGMSEEKLLGTRFIDLFSGASRERIDARLALMANSPCFFSDDEPVELAGRILTLAFLPVRHEELRSVVVIAHDITERKQAERKLAFEAGLNEAVARVSEMLISSGSMQEIADLVLSEARTLTESSHGFVGYVDEETEMLCPVSMGRDIWADCQLTERRFPLHSIRGLWAWVLTEKQPLLTNVAHSDPRSVGVPEGHVPVERFLGMPAMLNGQLIGLLSLVNSQRDYDLQDLKVVERLASLYALAIQKQRDEAQIEYLAHHDPLTGLVNRHLFNDRLASGLTLAARHRQMLALLFIDLNDFKLINDSLGHEVGDHVLCEVANRLIDSVRTSDTVARLGGDEFMIILHDLRNKAAAEGVAEKVLAKLAQPILVHDKVCSIGACIGISFYPDDGEDAETLLRKADKAMYCVKQNRASDFGFYGT